MTSTRREEVSTPKPSLARSVGTSSRLVGVALTVRRSPVASLPRDATRELCTTPCSDEAHP